MGIRIAILIGIFFGYAIILSVLKAMFVDKVQEEIEALNEFNPEKAGKYRIKLYSFTSTIGGLSLLGLLILSGWILQIPNPIKGVPIIEIFRIP